MAFDQKAIAGPSPGPSQGHRFSLKKAIENAKKIPHFFCAISIACMALAFLGHNFSWPWAWPSHGLEHGPRIAPSMAKPQPQSQRVVFGTTTQNPIIIQYAERGVARSLALAPPSPQGDFMAKKTTGKTTHKTDAKTAPPEPAKIGRPVVHGPDVWDEIVRRHADGETLNAICAGENMPSVSTVSRKAADDAEFGKRLTRATLAFADAIFAECMDIADNSGQLVKRTNAKGEDVTDFAATKACVVRDRLRVDTRMRICAKLNPLKYAERVNVNHSGSVDLNGVDDQTLNQRLIRRLHDLGVISLLESWDLTDEQKTQFLELFRVHELPTAPQAPRLLPGEKELVL